jgi:hypothetical protein
LKRCRKITACVNANLLQRWESYPQTISCKKLLKNVSEVYENCNKLNADAECWDDEKDVTHNVTTINVFEQIIDDDKIYPLPMDEFNEKKIYVIDDY